MKAGRWSVSAVWVAVVLTTLALAPAAVANHSVTELSSTGPTGGNGSTTSVMPSISQDGTHVFFVTTEALVSADTDPIGQQFLDTRDVYERAGGVTSLV